MKNVPTLMSLIAGIFDISGMSLISNINRLIGRKEGIINWKHKLLDIFKKAIFWQVDRSIFFSLRSLQRYHPHKNKKLTPPAGSQLVAYKC